ncbi:PemK family transcriptional regulator [Vagococcus penaei]|uniref:PemK family transcriptional regulator n=1 Tax=Vagococcus penaei TaxID=633807 RepID=A0A1Q2D5W9_9ENTE|nr:type II toxin-antitoxin system PemK/MazF family toxin [Vagococcus penaei]AQP53788.1 PemK family transcriptional regulator [Vagococcus penaei]RSU00380.1 PemK family transcriptional regulator [Vagococcus penaei]
MTKPHIPHKGDIVWIDFDPSTGVEIKKRRPALVVSNYDFNLSTKFAIVCPITSTEKNYPTRYNLAKDYQTKGQVVISQIKSLDYTQRHVEFIERIHASDLTMIDQIMAYIF